MPCNEATEIFEAVLSEQNRLEGYRYVKLSCGRGIGDETLLLGCLEGRTVDEILALEPAAFAPDFLQARHLAALQNTLALLVGRADCGPKQPCSAARVSFEDGKTFIRARLNVDIAMSAVLPCQTCGTCTPEPNP